MEYLPDYPYSFRYSTPGNSLLPAGSLVITLGERSLASSLLEQLSIGLGPSLQEKMHFLTVMLYI